MSDVTQFYDDLASDYRAIFPNWNQSVLRQAEILDSFIEHLGYNTTYTLWDCTCGIGTQAIGLATKGYSVTATDLSPNAIQQAKSYVTEFDIPIQPTFDVIDLLNPPDEIPQADIVVALDNAIAHFLDDDTLTTAISTMKRGLKLGGLLLISLANYDTTIQTQPRTAMPAVTDNDNGTFNVMYRVLNWSKTDDTYQIHLFFTRPDGDGWQTKCYVSTLRAIQQSTVTATLMSLGFHDIQWHSPEESGFYQPLLSAAHEGTIHE